MLDSQGRLDDKVAYQLLPRGSRRLVSPLPSRLMRKMTNKFDWIVDRTDFVDSEIEAFLSSITPGSRSQVVLLGSGYDTRPMRYSSYGSATFIEVDLPDVVETKMKLVNRYLSRRGGSTADVKYVPLDLNTMSEPGASVVDVLKTEAGLDPGLPTLVVCEAVMFYLEPKAARNIFDSLFGMPFSYVVVDNLAKVGVRPGGPPTPGVHEER